MERVTLEGLFMADHGRRGESLETARKCAKLTKPWILPDEGHATGVQGDSPRLSENFQSLGAWGITTLAGALATTLFPPLPWFKMVLDERIQYDPNVDPALKEHFARELFLREMILIGALESAGGRQEMRGRLSGFHSAKLRSINQLLITGDTLEMMQDDFRIRVYRRDHYTTRRDGVGDVLYHTVVEEIDPLSLSPDSPELRSKQLEAVGLDQDDLESKNPAERMMKLYTHVRWNPLSKKWTIEQEIKQKLLPLDLAGDTASEETLSPFFSTPYELVAGEDYGRGFVEQNRGDLTSLDLLSERMVDWAGLASKMVPVLDDTDSTTRASDLTKKTGEVIRGKVQGGRVQNVAFLSVEKVADFGVVRTVINDIEGRLAKAMLIGSESVRDSERTTAQEIEMLRQQVQGAMGGFFIPVADFMQRPVVNYGYHLMLKQKVVGPVQATIPRADGASRVLNLPREAQRVEILTGAAALARTAKVNDLLNIVQVAAALGPEAQAKIDTGVLLDAIARYRSVYEPGIIKSNERVAAEIQQQRRAQLQMEAEQQAIQTAGSVAESRLTA